jgi:hypothetical protein
MSAQGSFPNDGRLSQFTFGLCNLPPLADESKNNCYVRQSPVCSPNLPAPEIPVVNAVNALLATYSDNTHIPDIQIPMPENPGDTPMGVQNSASAQDLTKTMVWAGYMHTCAIPNQLRSALDNCLIYRRIVKDLIDDNKILDDSFTILYTEKHLSRHLCAESHNLEITLFYCDHPQHFMRELTETAMPVTGVQMNRDSRVRRDFGIRRRLADAGCGYDLVQSSIVANQGGQSFIRLQAPKYLNTANGLTSIHQEITMCIRQLTNLLKSCVARAHLL